MADELKTYLLPLQHEARELGLQQRKKTKSERGAILRRLMRLRRVAQILLHVEKGIREGSILF